MSIVIINLYFLSFYLNYQNKINLKTINILVSCAIKIPCEDESMYKIIIIFF